jgi:hypothetical protein
LGARFGEAKWRGRTHGAAVSAGDAVRQTDHEFEDGELRIEDGAGADAPSDLVRLNHERNMENRADRQKVIAIFVLNAQKFAAQTTENTETCSEFARVSALFAISAA